MSSIIRDTVETLQDTGIAINRFLYEDGKPFLKGGKPGKLIHHTEEEYVEFLNYISKDCFTTYRDFAIEYGWIEPPNAD